MCRSCAGAEYVPNAAPWDLRSRDLCYIPLQNMLADQCCSARACEIKYLIRYLISQARDYRRRQFERMPILIAAYALSARPCIVSKCFWPAAMLLATSMSVLNIFSILGIWIKVGLSLNSGCKSSGALSGITRNRRGPIIHMRKLMRAPVAQAVASDFCAGGRARCKWHANIAQYRKLSI